MPPEPEIARLLAELACATAERDTAIAERNAVVEERDAAVEERDAAVEARKVAAAQRDAAVTAKKKLAHKVLELEHRLGLLLQRLYGRSSEKVDPRQILLEFARAQEEEAAALPTPPDGDEAPDGEARPEGAEKQGREKQGREKNGKKGHGWGRLPADIRRERVEVAPSDADLVCDCCGGQRTSIGSPEITERLDYQPASVFIVETVRHRFRCPKCQDGTAIAELPPPPIEAARGRAEAGLLAHVAVSKFNDHLPLNRQCEILEREGVEISRSTLGDWVRGTAELLRPVAGAVLEDVLTRPVVGLDETGVRVVFDKHDPKNGTRNARIWVYRGLPGEVYFTVSETKAKDDIDGPKTVLAGFRGFVQADAAGTFDDLFKDGTRLEVGCNGHARRKFFEARKANPQEAAYALATYRKVYEIEARVRDAPPEERLAARQTETKPILAAFDAWLDELVASGLLVPGTPLATAVGYSRNHRVALRRFLDDPRL
ncbi:MAG TPA: IS66 family transposase, partial [Gaiellaceae bacterium]|nr:IS66 family transposase [Gaiellaceae bacterium]